VTLKFGIASSSGTDDGPSPVWNRCREGLYVSTEAKRRFSVADHIAATAGVECRKEEDVLDETPAAYKPIDRVMHAQRDLVEVVHTLRQIVCVKG